VPDLLLVGASCTAELIQDDPGGLARALALPIPVVALELPAYQRKEDWGAAETFYQLVRACVRPAPRAPRDCIAEVAALAGVDPAPVLAGAPARSAWYARSVDSNSLTGKRVFIFGDATHAIAAARVASQELGFAVVGLGSYARCLADIGSGDIDIATMLFLDDHIRAVLPALQARRGAARRVRCDAVLHVGERGGAPHPARPLQHGRGTGAGDGAAQTAARRRAQWGEERRARERAAADAHLAPVAPADAIHPRHRAGRAGVFPGAAILARRLGGESRQSLAHDGRSLCGGTTARCTSQPRCSIPMSASITRASPGGSSRASRNCRRRPSRWGRSGCCCAPTRSPAMPGITMA
jgi:hypothetical protein